MHLSDVMIRRGGWHHYWAEVPQMAVEAAAWMAEVLGWSAEQRAREMADYQAVIRADGRVARVNNDNISAPCSGGLARRVSSTHGG